MSAGEGLYDKDQIDDWLHENVISNLLLESHIPYKTDFDNQKICGSTEDVRIYLEEWLSQFKSIEIWGDCLSYDWVLFNQIFGHAFNIPKAIYYIPFDLCTLFRAKKIDPDVSREEFAGMTKGSQKHNALWDAKVIRKCYLKAIQQPWC